MTGLLHFEVLILQFIILLIGALRRRLKLRFWQHSELDAAETGTFHVLAFIPASSSSHLNSFEQRPWPGPLVYGSRVCSSTPSPSKPLHASPGGADPSGPVLCAALGYWGWWSSAVVGLPAIRESTGCCSPCRMGGSALHSLAAFLLQAISLNMFCRFIFFLLNR